MPNIRVHVDFNDIEDGSLAALVRHADDPSALVPGARVLLWDEDGNTAEGSVTEIGDRGIVRISMLGGTWCSRLDQQRRTDLVAPEDLVKALFQSYAPTVASVEGFYRLWQSPSSVAPTTTPTLVPWLPVLPRPVTAVPSSV